MKTKLTHLVLFIVTGLLRVLPLGMQERLGNFVGSFFCRMSPGHVKLMVSNLRRAFGDRYTQEELEDIALKSIQNMAKSFFEFSRFPLYSTEDIVRMVEFEPEDEENMRNALSEGKGVVLASAHFGNWEMMAARLITLGTPMTVVGRTQNDSFLDEYIVKMRTSKGTKNIPRGVPMYEHITGLLANNELVGLVSDQNAGNKGLFVEFFDSRVSAFKGPGMFALRTGCKIVPVFIVRKGYQRHRGFICPAVEIKTTGDAGKDIVAYTRAYTKVIEGFVDKYPDQWFWIHKRWKTLPPGEDEEGD